MWYFDFKKAFVTVNHKILLDKLNHYGIRGLALDFFTSYLKNRQQFVFANGVQSKMQITCGVPQGSTLGPVLFLLYCWKGKSSHGRRKNVFRREQRDILHIFFRFLTLQCIWTFTKCFTVSTPQSKCLTKARAPFASILKYFSSGPVYQYATKVYFLSSVTAFAELAHKCRYHRELHTKWDWNGLEQSATVCGSLISPCCLNRTHFWNLLSKLFSMLRLSEMLFQKLRHIHFCEHFLQISHNLITINDQINIRFKKTRKLDTLAKLFHKMINRSVS